MDPARQREKETKDARPYAEPTKRAALDQLPDDVERSEGELQQALRQSSMEALVHYNNLTEQDVERMVKARLKLIQEMRSLALKVTKAEDWTLWADREGHSVATPRASAMLAVRPWFNVRIFNHRGLDGQPGQPSVKTIKVRKKDTGEDVDVTVLEGLCDVQLGKDWPLEGIYFSLRSDDDFTGRVKREDRLGGPREIGRAHV